MCGINSPLFIVIYIVLLHVICVLSENDEIKLTNLYHGWDISSCSGWQPGPFQYQNRLHAYRNSHLYDKTVVIPPNLYDENPSTDRVASLHRNGPQVACGSSFLSHCRVKFVHMLGLNLCLRPANEKLRYFVTTSAHMAASYPEYRYFTILLSAWVWRGTHTYSWNIYSWIPSKKTLPSRHKVTSFTQDNGFIVYHATASSALFISLVGLVINTWNFSMFTFIWLLSNQFQVTWIIWSSKISSRKDYTLLSSA